MTAARLFYTRHALDRMTEMNVDREHVERVVATSRQITADPDSPHRTRCHWTDIVVVLDHTTPAEPAVVTVLWRLHGTHESYTRPEKTP